MAKNCHSFEQNTLPEDVDKYTGTSYATIYLDHGTSGLTINTPNGYVTIRVQEDGKISVIGPMGKAAQVAIDNHERHEIGIPILYFIP